MHCRRVRACMYERGRVPAFASQYPCTVLIQPMRCSTVIMTLIQTCVSTYKHTCIYIHTAMHAYIHPYTHTHACTCVTIGDMGVALLMNGGNAGIKTTPSINTHTQSNQACSYTNSSSHSDIRPTTHSVTSGRRQGRVITDGAGVRANTSSVHRAGNAGTMEYLSPEVRACV